jgi:hydroxyacylglutathione hydrolase
MQMIGRAGFEHSIFDIKESIVTAIECVPALVDNYIFIYRYEGNKAFVVDPGDADPVLEYASKHEIEIKLVFNTHYHFDHTDGNAKLKEITGCEIIGPDRGRISTLDRVVNDGDRLPCGPVEIRVISTPGHTESDVCYFMTRRNGDPVLWSGDTLFVGGCGRLYGGGAEALFDSLNRLASLSEETLVFCSHEYGAENLRYALTIEPNNKTLQARYQELLDMRKQSRPTVPSTIVEEKGTNIFLRAGVRSVKSALGLDNSEPFDVFVELRRRKDVFK